MGVTLYQSDRGSFFTSQQNNPTSTGIISAQIDPSEPQVDGLTSVTDPLIPNRTTRSRVSHMDPSQYDLRDSSHLMKFIKAIIGSGGAGGVRKQLLINRLSTTFSGSNFADLDAFWGAMFGMPRLSTEAMPQNADGTSFNPMTGVTDEDTWDLISSADGQYRSRLVQFVQALNMGATREGILMAAEAVLGVDVDLAESWVLADQIPPGVLLSAINGNNYFVVTNRYLTYGGMSSHTWGQLVGGEQTGGQVPLGNRGEIVLKPKSPITQEQKRHVHMVLDQLMPAGTMLTILDGGTQVLKLILAQNLYAESEDWRVISSVTQSPGLNTPVGAQIYPNQGQYSAGRPALSAYTGESWDYNSRISSITSYTLTPEGDPVVGAGADWGIVTFFDGTSHAYTPDEAVMTPQRAASARSASDGVMTSYPYSAARAS
jgi:hypothetical protein